jgi:hypothetical protein
MGKGLAKGTSQTSVTGPHMVILTTPTALRVAIIISWVHHSRVKRAFDPDEMQLTKRWTSTPDPSQPLHLWLHWDITSQLNSWPQDSPNAESLKVSSPAPVTPEADWPTYSRSLRKLHVSAAVPGQSLPADNPPNYRTVALADWG